MSDKEVIRRAERLLHRATTDALRRTMGLLRLIAAGKFEPSVAGEAADDLMRLLEVVAIADEVTVAVRRRSGKPAPASSDAIH